MRALPCFVLLLASSTAAVAGNNELTIGNHARSLRSSSANAVSEDELYGGALGLARRLPLHFDPRLELWATAGLTWGGMDGTMFQTLNTETSMVGFSFGGRARYVLHPNLVVGARLDVGTARTSLTLRAIGSTVSDAAWGGTSTAAASIDLFAIARPRFSLGLRFELGYVAATAPDLSPREDMEDGKITLDEMQASIGGLDLGGRFMLFTLLSQF